MGDPYEICYVEITGITVVIFTRCIAVLLYLQLTDIFMPIYACAEMWFAKPDALKVRVVWFLSPKTQDLNRSFIRYPERLVYVQFMSCVRKVGELVLFVMVCHGLPL